MTITHMKMNFKKKLMSVHEFSMMVMSNDEKKSRT